jgi:cytochrome c-type biogenesis protein CcmF
MLPIFGYGILVITFLLALYGVGASIYGAIRNRPAWVESGRLSMLLTFPSITLAAMVLVILLVSGRYEVQFVYSVTSSSMPLYLKITALWGGQAGSLLFWAWLLSAFASAVALRKWDRDREFLPWVTVVCMITLAFFLMLIVFVKGQVPFERFWAMPDGSTNASVFQPSGSSLITPSDGNGLNPLLRHPGMIAHPPMLYLGFVSFVIPFAFGVAALITGRSDDRWIRVTRRWTLVAWLFLSIGLVLGMRWAYDVLGWGGYWGWDPVENAALMPWLVCTAFLHSVMIQEKRGLFKQWNMVLVILTYSLVIYGTFLTRSGVLSSVHAFSQSSIGPLFFGFIALTFSFSLGMLLYRWNELKSENQLTSWISREALFLVNNFLFMGLFVIVFWGVNYPLISELITNQKVTVGASWYQQATGPLWAAIVFLMGIAPLSAWGYASWKAYGRSIWKPFIASLLVLAAVFITGVRQPLALLAFWLCGLTGSITLYEYGRAVYVRRHNTGENIFLAFWMLATRNRRRYGGYIVHLGVVLMAIGVVGIEMFQTQTQGTIPVGGSLSIDSYTIKFKDLSVFDAPDGRNVARAVIGVSRDGKDLGELYPRRDFYYDANQPMTIPGLRSTPEDDLYIVLVDWEAISTNGVTFKIYHNPLVMWMWVGGLLLMIGSLVAAWPTGDGEAARQLAPASGT